MLGHRLFWCLSFLLLVSAESGLPDDPYLQYKPAFARSLPVQILLTGIVLTLVAVLFIHLIFTAQYHWPLAPVNYVLQMSGVITLLISLIATLHVVLSATLDESKNWPYMFSYMAVNVPPADASLGSDTEEGRQWTIAEKATWLVMNASTSITHIQFLTLLYPSKLEGRLIFVLLGPLAIVSAVMQLLPIHGSEAVINVASVVRNVCNATLSLLFTAALFIWGLLINRQQAWRTDGGTAAFGAAALLLAVASTALTFLYVPREEEYAWLPGLMWAIILWQSFLGWWWWVGAGSGGGMSDWDDRDAMEEEMVKREKREKRKKAKLERRKERSEKAKLVLRGVAGAFGKPREHSGDEDQSLTRRRRRQQIRAGTGTERSRSPSDTMSHAPTSPTSPTHENSAGVDSASTYSTSSARTYATLPRSLPTFVHQWYASLRRAHVAAARKQAAERAERIRELDRNGSRWRPATPNRRNDPGWGLGSFGWRLGQGRRPSFRDESHTEEEEEDRRRSRGRRLGLSEREREVRVDQRHPHFSDNENGSNEPVRDTLPTTSPTIQHRTPSSMNTGRQSVWWWGPLSRWRLQDSSTY
ncbi:hypothetical protein ONZ45_g2964 [Pleurotus djamor]|nr:hypothetical protein ONZ45_g2964 [Pleurotus djamor]